MPRAIDPQLRELAAMARGIDNGLQAAMDGGNGHAIPHRLQRQHRNAQLPGGNVVGAKIGHGMRIGGDARRRGQAPQVCIEVESGLAIEVPHQRHQARAAQLHGVVHAGIPRGDATGAALLVRARHEHAHAEGAAQLLGLRGVVPCGGLRRVGVCPGGKLRDGGGQQRARAALGCLPCGFERGLHASRIGAVIIQLHHADGRVGRNQRAEHEGAIQCIVQHAHRAAHRAAHRQRAGEPVGIPLGHRHRDQAAHR